jgi:tetratricopeptide (TPR) repeat protein
MSKNLNKCLRSLCVGFIVTLFLSCNSGLKPEDVKINTAQGLSLLNKPLIRPQVDLERDSLQIANYLDALADYENNKEWADNVVWLGRRVAYLGDYKRAIELFTEGVKKFPEDPQFLRHRGHRYISTRQIDEAVSDFEKASEIIKGTEDVVEADGIPNRLNQPVSSLHTNIYYHLGLAYYIKGDFKSALTAFSNCLDVSKNDDMQVATRHWLYMILNRLNRKEVAEIILEPIHENMNIIENVAYHELLLFYKGLRTEKVLLKENNGAIGANEATQYGIANWHYYSGDTEKAMHMFNDILKNGNWSSFGYIAAEADLARSEN